MKKLLCSLITLFALAINVAYAAPATPKAGDDYRILKTAKPVNVAAGKIEILEFFWYGCPHCYTFEPILATWLQKQKADVVFKRVPVAFRKEFIAHQKLYHVIDTLGLTKQLSAKIFEAIQVEKNYLLTPEAQADFLVKHGISKDKFLKEYHSFGIDSAARQDRKLMDEYEIDGVPTIMVQGKYETSPAMTNSFENTVQVLDFLIEQIRAKKM